MAAEDFPGAQFTVREGYYIPTKQTVSNAAAALAADDSPEHIRQSASDVLMRHRDILETHPSWAADFDKKKKKD